MPLFFSSRFQDQVGDASVGTKNLMPLLGMLDDIAIVLPENSCCSATQLRASGVPEGGQ
jgi:hypothetical protein